MFNSEFSKYELDIESGQVYLQCYYGDSLIKSFCALESFMLNVVSAYIIYD